MEVLYGIPASPGIVIGKAFIFDREELQIEEMRIDPTEVEDEIQKFLFAIEETKQEIEGLGKVFGKGLGEDLVRIFDIHLLILKDVSIIDQTIKEIKKTHKNAEFVFSRTIGSMLEILERSKDKFLIERKDNIIDVKRRVVRKLLNKERKTLSDIEEDVVVIAHELMVSDAVTMRRDKVMGFTTDVGGATSHITILARALEIPAVVGLGSAARKVKPGDLVIIDGFDGILTINPTQEALVDYIRERKKRKELQKGLEVLREFPAITLDKHKIELSANIEMVEEADKVVSHGANGIGLYRTEFLFLSGTPTEEVQYNAYRTVLSRIYPARVIIRTFDLGGDKLYADARSTIERNPALGWRAIRLCLDHKDFFKTQLRAILRAGVGMKLGIMFPMISQLEEVYQIKEVLEETEKELRYQGIPFTPDYDIGLMIETPSAAILSEEMAKEVDFFSIGTNDLTQYTVAADRGNEKVAYLYQPYNPAVLRLIKFVIDAGHKSNIWVGVCGEMAGSIPTALLLLGMGVDELSANPSSIPEVKNAIRSITLEEVKGWANTVLSMNSTNEIKSFIEGKVKEKFPNSEQNILSKSNPTTITQRENVL